MNEEEIWKIKQEFYQQACLLIKNQNEILEFIDDIYNRLQKMEKKNG